MAASVKQGFRQFRPKMQGASVGLVMRRGETLCQYLFDGFDADRAVSVTRAPRTVMLYEMVEPRCP